MVQESPENFPEHNSVPENQKEEKSKAIVTSTPKGENNFEEETLEEEIFERVTKDYPETLRKLEQEEIDTEALEEENQKIDREVFQATILDICTRYPESKSRAFRMRNQPNALFFMADRWPQYGSKEENVASTFKVLKLHMPSRTFMLTTLLYRHGEEIEAITFGEYLSIVLKIYVELYDKNEFALLQEFHTYIGPQVEIDRVLRGKTNQ
jgi:hypothetical protein